MPQKLLKWPKQINQWYAVRVLIFILDGNKFIIRLITQWLEYTPDKRKVSSSNLLGPIIFYVNVSKQSKTQFSFS